MPHPRRRSDPPPGLILGRRIGRRAFLRGAGAALALPWLEAMAPARAASFLRAGGGGPPIRVAFVFTPNGQHMPDWKPSSDGTGFELPFILEPLAPVRDRVTVLTGLALDGGRPHGDGPGDHARAAASFLTCAHPRKTGGADIQAGVSVDQVIAAAAGGATRFPSLELGCEGGRASGICDSGYSCAYSNHISWKTPSLPLAKEHRPRAVFRRLFGRGSDGDEDVVEAGRRRKERASILDAVLEDARSLDRKLGPGDRRKLAEYLDAVREIETRIARSDAGEEVPAVARDFQAPAGIPEDYGEHLRLMYDLMALAFRTDLTRVATFMTGNAGSNRSYRFLDCPDGHHDTSHHGNATRKQTALRTINRWHVGHFARFLEGLAKIEDGDAPLLDRCLVVYGSGIGDGDRHNHDDLPVLLAGRGGGTVKGGRHLRLGRETPMADFYLSILDRCGVRKDSFGDGAGRIEGL